MKTRGAAEEPALGSMLRSLVDDLGALVAGHVKLARVELAEGARGYGRRVAFVALAAAIMLIGYSLACVAAALALSARLGPPAAFLLVGGVHLVGGGIAVAVLLARAAPAPLDGSLSELHRTIATLASGAEDARRLVGQPAAEGTDSHGVA